LSAQSVPSVSSSSVERQAPSTISLLLDRAGVDARAAESDLRAAADRRGEESLEVVVAVGCVLPGERAADRVREQEDAHGLAVACGERVRQSESVVRALRAVGGVVCGDACA
jgi:hypothetical protein